MTAKRRRRPRNKATIMLDHVSTDATPTTGLVRYDAMCRAIDAAYAVDEVKAIHDKAAMLQAAARVAHNFEAETRAYEIRMRAARKAGELSKKIEKIDPKVSGTRGDLPRSKGDTLSDAGISTQQASEWERLAVPQDEFEAALATKSVRDLGDGSRSRTSPTGRGNVGSPQTSSEARNSRRSQRQNMLALAKENAAPKRPLV